MISKKITGVAGVLLLGSAVLPTSAQAKARATPLETAKAECSAFTTAIQYGTPSFGIHRIWFSKGTFDTQTLPALRRADRLFFCIESKVGEISQLQLDAEIFSFGGLTHRHGIRNPPIEAPAPVPAGTKRYVFELPVEWIWTAHFVGSTWPCDLKIKATGIHCGPRPPQTDTFVRVDLSGLRKDGTWTGLENIPKATKVGILN